MNAKDIKQGKLRFFVVFFFVSWVCLGFVCCVSVGIVGRPNSTNVMCPHAPGRDVWDREFSCCNETPPKNWGREPSPIEP